MLVLFSFTYTIYLTIVSYIVSEFLTNNIFLSILPLSADTGGLVENRIMSRDELLNAAKLPSLDVVRGQLVSLLNSSASNTSRMLAHHQGALSANLTQLVKQAGDGNGDGGDASAT